MFSDVKLSLQDISIVPCVNTDIKSRSECNPYYYGSNQSKKLGTKSLPLFTAPMSTVVEEQNLEIFLKNNIEPILPRNICLNKRIDNLKMGYWCAFGLSDINTLLSKNIFGISFNSKVLIDVANGHMDILYDLVKDIKKQNNATTIMIGNIANPDTYYYCCKNNIDYVRVGIGGGSGCLTSSNTGVFYPAASLISEIYEFKKELVGKELVGLPIITKIVADGCARGYSDIIKALALGADYVMCGKLFAQMLETPGEIIADANNGSPRYILYQYNYDGADKGYPFTDDKYNYILTLTKEFYGMASKRGQQDFCVPRLKTAEGKVEKIEIKYTIAQWVENFIDYLKSAMAYTGKRDITDFIGGVDIIRLSENAKNSYNK